MRATDEHLTRLAAEKIMGWTVKNCRSGEYYEDSSSDRIYPWVRDWKPLTDWRAAGEIVEKISKKFNFQIDSVGHYPDIWRCMIGWSDDPVSVTYESPCAPRSITICALLAVGAIEEEDLA